MEKKWADAWQQNLKNLDETGASDVDRRSYARAFLREYAKATGKRGNDPVIRDFVATNIAPVQKEKTSNAGEAFLKSAGNEFFNKGITAQARKFIAKKTGVGYAGDIPGLDVEAEGTGAQLASDLGSFAGSMVDPASLTIDAATAGAGKWARGAKLASKIVGRIPHGVISSAASGAVQSGLLSGLSQANDGKVNAGEVARQAGAGALMTGLFSAAPSISSAAKKVKAGRLANEAGAVSTKILDAPLRVVEEITQEAPTPNAAHSPFPQPEPKVSEKVVQLFGDDAKNLKGSARKVAEAVADNPEMRPVASPESVASVKPDEFFNFRRAGLSPELENSMRKTVQEVAAENGYNPKQRIGFDEIKAEAAAIDPALVHNLKIPKDGETLNPAVRVAARNHLNGLIDAKQEVLKKLSQAGDEMTNAEREELSKTADRLDFDAKKLLDVLIPTRSQDGRNLAYHRIEAGKTFDAEYWMARARKINGALDDDLRNEIGDILHRGRMADEAGDADAANRARRDLALKLSKLDKTGAVDTLLTLRKAGLLTGPKTVARNLMGNGAFAIAEEVARVPSSIADIGMSIFTKKRTVQGVNPVAIAHAGYEAATNGLREAGQIMRHGATNEALEKFDLPKELNSNNQVLNTYANTVFRFMSAQDRISKTYAMRRSLEAQAFTMAKNKAKPGENVNKLAANIMENLSSSMMAQAIADAEFATFNNDNALASAVSRFKGAHPAIRAAADVIMPFVKTPLNVTSRILDYAVVGGLVKGGKAAASSVKNGALSEKEQKVIAEAFGRGSIGGGLLLAGYYLGKNGHMTGTYQPNPTDSGRNEAANRPNGSVKIGDRWYQIGMLSPIGNLLVVGATLAREGVTPENALSPESMAKTFAAGVKTAMDQPFTQGAQQVTDLAKDPVKQAGKFAADVSGSFVPSIINDVSTLTDDKQREAKGIVQGLQKRIPGLRNQLPEKVDALGRTIPNEAKNAIDPFLSREAMEDKDPTIKELVRLEVSMPKPQDFIRYKGKRFDLDQEHYNDFIKTSGQLFKEKMDRVVASQKYQAAKARGMDEELKSYAETVMQAARDKAKIQVLRKMAKEGKLVPAQ